MWKKQEWRDEKKAVELYTPAANQGDVEEWRKEKVVELCTLASNQGNAPAQFNLGLCYAEQEWRRMRRKSWNSTPSQPTRAMPPHSSTSDGVMRTEQEWRRMRRAVGSTLSSNQGNASAHLLGWVLYAWNRSREDTSNYTLAANEGHVTAQFNLGLCYAHVVAIFLKIFASS